MSSKPLSVPEPGPSWPAMLSTVRTMKEHVEVLAGDRGDMLDSAVTYRDLIALGMLRESDMAQIRLRHRTK